MSIVLALTILAGTWSLMHKSMNLMLDAVPENIALEEVKASLCSLPRVIEVHDLAYLGTEHDGDRADCAPGHAGQLLRAAFLAAVCHELQEWFDIDHASLQIDPLEALTPCALVRESSNAIASAVGRTRWTRVNARTLPRPRRYTGFEGREEREAGENGRDGKGAASSEEYAAPPVQKGLDLGEVAGILTPAGASRSYRFAPRTPACVRCSLVGGDMALMDEKPQ